MSELTATKPMAIGDATRMVFLSTVLAKPVQFASNIAFARILDPSAFGILGLANSAAVTLSGIAGLGLGDAAAKFLAQHHRRDGARAQEIGVTILATSLVVGTFLIAVAWMTRGMWLYRFFPKGVSAPTVSLCLMLALLNLISSLFVNIFTGLQRFFEVAIIGVVQPVVALVAGVIFGVLHGVEGAQAGYALAALCCIAFAVYRLPWIKSSASAHVLPALSHLREVVGFSFPVWAATFVINPITVYTFSLLARQPNGAYELARVDVADGLKMLVAVLPGIITPVLTPALIEAVNDPDPARGSRVVENALAAYSALVIPASVGMLFLSDVLLLLYGRPYAGTERLLMPLASAIVLSILSAPMQTALVGRGWTWRLLFMFVAKSLLTLGCSLVFIPRLLGPGLVWSFFFSEVLFSVAACEMCVLGSIISPRIRLSYYALVAFTGAILAAALVLPHSARWALAVPGALVCGIALLRWRPNIAGWITAAAPRATRAYVTRSFALVLGQKA